MSRDSQALGVLVAGAFSLLVATAARADQTAANWLSVERSDDALSCPDASALQSAAEALLESPPDGQTRLIHVAFERREGRYLAILRRADSDHAGRKLRDTHSDCEPLAQAVATTLALMLETRAGDAKPSEPARRRTAPIAQPAPEQRPAAPRPRAPDYEFALGVSAGAGQGVIHGWSPLLAGHLAFGSGALRVSLGALQLLPTTRELGPGSVEVELTAVTTRACLRWLDSIVVDFYACSGVFGGVLQARARGYTSDFERSRPWLALPLELFAAVPFGAEDSALGLRAGGTLLVPARRETFAVQGLGAAVEPERVAVLLWLGFDGSLYW
jgi:hypothetical protein